MVVSRSYCDPETSGPCKVKEVLHRAGTCTANTREELQSAWDHSSYHSDFGAVRGASDLRLQFWMGLLSERWNRAGGSHCRRSATGRAHLIPARTYIRDSSGGTGGLLFNTKA